MIIMNEKDKGLIEILTGKEITITNNEIRFLLVGVYLGIILNHMDLCLCW